MKPIPHDLVKDTLAELREYNISRLVLSPNRWKACNLKISLKWRVVKFDKTHKSKIPLDKQGVYTFVVKPGIANHPECSYLLYVGKTERQGLRTRFLQYFGETKKPTGRPYIKEMIRLWNKHLWFCYATIDDVKKIGDIENKLIEAYVPPMNEDFQGVVGKAMKAWR
ncbi:MAG TPA: hypothetical protein VEY11_13990 [Pyrinomonadaceae bacterium]|nr:hypothetical protein [Pyrinomonadaceae bacterium]